MSATISHRHIGRVPASSPFRLGFESVSAEHGERSVQWLLERNCSMAPRQLVMLYLLLCTVSLGIASGFWMQGATLVMPFTGLELLAVGAAFLAYARHATDNESIRLQPGRLTVEHASGKRVVKVEFAPAWVRVEPEHGDRSLVELSGQGRRISVGRFVRPELRRQLAEELRWALRRWQTAASAPQSAARQ